jgi:hypothetical protein
LNVIKQMTKTPQLTHIHRRALCMRQVVLVMT